MKKSSIVKSSMLKGSPTRLQKILSAAGVASRRAAERLMAEGRVSVNGEMITKLGSRADPDQDDIRVDGRRVRVATRRIYLLLNKPRGYVTTRSDPEGRRTMLDLLPRVREYLYPVGRLDYDSEGLLLLTNDGDLAARLTHPRHEIERTYHARVRGVPDDAALTSLARGIVIDGRRTAPAKVRLLPSARAHERPRPAPVAKVDGALERASTGSARSDLVEGRGWGPASMKKRARSLAAPGGGAPGALKDAILEITIHEGRSRQVRKMCEAVGHPVWRLQRVRFGPIEDPMLKTGSYRELTTREVALLRKATVVRREPRDHKI